MIVVHTWRRTVPPNDYRFTVWKSAAQVVSQEWNLTLDEALELRTKLTEALEGISPREKA